MLNTLQFLGYDRVRTKFTFVKLDNLDDGMFYSDGDASAARRIALDGGAETVTMIHTRKAAAST